MPHQTTMLCYVMLCYMFKRHFGACSTEDDVGDMSMSEDSTTLTTTTAPQVTFVSL